MGFTADEKLKNSMKQEPPHIMENIVYNELRIRGYYVDTGIIDVYGKDQEGKRVRIMGMKYVLLDSDSLEF